MELLKFISLYVVIVLVTMVVGRRMRMSEADITFLTEENRRNLRKDPREGRIVCSRLAKEPYFQIEILLGQVWRIYYSWNMDLRKYCMDMRFKNATRLIVNRMHNDMSEYLKTEPDWDAASVLVRMSRGRHEMLLFADQRYAGKFKGVPNLIRNGDFLRQTSSVPLLDFHLKLMNVGKYLLMADCQVGVTTLSANRKYKPNRTELAIIAKNLNFGHGREACLSD